MDKSLREAVTVLNAGGIVIYPTDTAFGIGCRIDKPEGVDRLFRIRQRPLTQATPVLVSSMEMALAHFDHPGDIVRRLMKIYWPGALTIVSSAKTSLFYSPIRGGTDTVGLRMPDHVMALSLIKGAGVPILGPSANFHGHPTPFFYKDLDPELIALVDYVLPGECKTGAASTVVDVTTVPPTILRDGAVKLKEGDLA